jgi:hypothetical protein
MNNCSESYCRDPTMYVQRQRKNLKPCLGFQRYESKILKSSLRRFKSRSKQTHLLYKLLSRLLRVYKIPSIQDHLIAAIQNEPPRILTSFSSSGIDLDPFPDHIFPPFRSLKRRIAKANRHKQMDPVHWESGIRPNRPFEHFQQRLSFSPPRPPPPPQQASRQRQIPTQYYLEQAPFYAENFGPDPFATEPGVIQSGPLKNLVLKFLRIFGVCVVPGLDVIASLVFGLLLLARLIAHWALLIPFKRLYKAFLSVEWEMILVMAIANQIVSLLPGMDVEALKDGGEGDGPVYTMFVQGGRAIGNGPVMGGSL